MEEEGRIRGSGGRYRSLLPLLSFASECSHMNFLFGTPQRASSKTENQRLGKVEKLVRIFHVISYYWET